MVLVIIGRFRGRRDVLYHEDLPWHPACLFFDMQVSAYYACRLLF